jgi:hypothetical protein
MNERPDENTILSPSTSTILMSTVSVGEEIRKQKEKSKIVVIILHSIVNPGI